MSHPRTAPGRAIEAAVLRDLEKMRIRRNSTVPRQAGRWMAHHVATLIDNVKTVSTYQGAAAEMPKAAQA